MTLNVEELLDACDRLCSTLPEGHERDSGRGEIVRLRRTVSELPVLIDDTAAWPSGMLPAVRLLAQVRAAPQAPTEVLLRRWRQAESALSAAEPGTLAWLITCLAVESARDDYHARTNALASDASGDRSGVASVRP